MLEIIIPLVVVGCVIAGLYWYDKTYHAVTPLCKSDTPRPRHNKLDITLLTRPAVVHRRQRYVCGFAFHTSDGRPRVVLIRKVKPDWQAGKLNGVGGKIEKGETPEQAMAREFFEEAGVKMPVESWEQFAVMRFPKAEVVFLRTFNEYSRNANTQTVWSDEVQAHITEKIEHRLVRGIDEIADNHVMPNCRWAIPLAFHNEGGRSLVTVEYDEHN